MLSQTSDEDSISASEQHPSEARSYNYRYKIQIIDDKIWKYEHLSENRWKVYPKEDPAIIHFENDEGEKIE
jgi:hypothetical protein